MKKYRVNGDVEYTVAIGEDFVTLQSGFAVEYSTEGEFDEDAFWDYVQNQNSEMPDVLDLYIYCAEEITEEE